MKNIILLLTCLLFIGCGKNDPRTQSESTSDNNEWKLKKANVYEIDIDGCQYLITTYGKAMTHKANCTNPIHEWNKTK